MSIFFIVVAGLASALVGFVISVALTQRQPNMEWTEEIVLLFTAVAACEGAGLTACGFSVGTIAGLLMLFSSIPLVIVSCVSSIYFGLLCKTAVSVMISFTGRSIDWLTNFHKQESEVDKLRQEVSELKSQLAQRSVDGAAG